MQRGGSGIGGGGNGAVLTTPLPAEPGSHPRDGEVKGWQSLRLCSQGCDILSLQQHRGWVEVAKDTLGGCLNSSGMQEC